MKHIRLAVPFFALVFLAGCHSAPSTADLPPVRNFDLHRYCGVWYEIARLPHSFEDGMTAVKTTYTLRDDGKLSVLNEGIRGGKKKEITGVGRFKNAENVGELEVSFFRPFYGDYKIIELDDAYTVAVVTSAAKDYFWILARTPEIPEAQRAAIVRRAAGNGFETGKLIFAQ
ncbi:MAG: lipocalin family protein [Victivallaceae bacterium]|nr:lipocalin family protein [Victivallaceae bacterium]